MLPSPGPRCYPERVDRRVVALALGLGLGLAPACARKAEEATRSAWEAAMKAQGAGKGDASGGAGGDPNERGDAQAEAWTAVSAIIESISESLASGVATVDLEALATRLCGATPDRLDESGETVFTCEPDPKVLVDNESLEYEISESGVVGLVAPDVDASESQELLSGAMERLRSACRRPWAPVDASAENAHDEFYTCTLTSGSMVAVGRFPRDLVAGQWQFSLTVLGPG